MSSVCFGVECPLNASCVLGECECDAGYKPARSIAGSSDEPELECVPDPCYGVVCGRNSSCSNG